MMLAGKKHHYALSHSSSPSRRESTLIFTNISLARHVYEIRSLSSSIGSFHRGHIAAIKMSSESDQELGEEMAKRYFTQLPRCHFVLLVILDVALHCDQAHKSRNAKCEIATYFLSASVASGRNFLIVLRFKYS